MEQTVSFENHVMWYLLGYSFLMFTLPFIGFFFMKYFLGQILNVQGYTVIALSVIFAVIIVQLIIYFYVKQAFNEPVDKNSDGEDENIIDNDEKVVDKKKDQ